MLLSRGPSDVGMKSLTTLKENKPLMWQGSVGDDLDHLEKDRAIHTDPDETRRRRTIKLHQENNKWGFTLQTYGIKNKKTNELEVMTYVDYVELHSSAGLAGMRRGDVILSVNGESVEGEPHKILVRKIKDAKDTLRLVVLFEDCCRKVELYERFIKLKQVLKAKLDELRYLEKKEHYILEGHGGFSRFSSVRSSLRSSASSDWDRFSMVVSPAQMLQNLPNKLTQQHFLFPRAYPRSVDDSSEISLNDITLNDSFSDDNDAFLDSSASCSDIVSLQGIRKNKVDSLSNKSVSSLITNAENQEKDATTEEKSEAEVFQVEESFKEVNSGITTHSEKDGADTELVLPWDHKDCVNSSEITLDNSMPLDSNSENIADVGDHSEGESDKGDNFEGESGKGDLSKGESDKGDNFEGESGKGDLSEGESDKGDNFDADSGKGDHSERASGKVDKSVDMPNLIDAAAPECQPKAGDQTDTPQVSEINDNKEHGSSSDAARKDNSPETMSRPKHSKRFVRGILVNDYDEITKL
ncbi:fibrinogen-binding protein-like isoform X1 [Haliotis cracherodii]|uniref:fibrinogen-binding protein-like isoform X1 n=2 Tax=Haliotis cracherodii TaxID=6455 RepID=UPI0039E9CF20